MKIRNNPLLRLCGIFLIIAFLLTSGCINYVPALLGGGETDNGLQREEEYFGGMALAPGQMAPVGEAVVPVPDSTPVPTLEIEEVSPDPYVTQDPYRHPYRDHGTWSTVDAVRIEKIPQYSKSFVLRSNSTAVKVNAPKAPLVIDLTFTPEGETPDRTSGASGSFAYSKALVTVHPQNSTAILEQEGYGCEYSTDKEKRITLYRDGTFIIALSGDFIKVKMDIISGDGADKPLVPVPATRPFDDEDEYW